MVLGSIWEGFGTLWAALSRSWAPLLRLWSESWTLLEVSEAFWVFPGRCWVDLGSMLGAFWMDLGRIWDAFSVVWEGSGSQSPHLALFRRVLGLSLHIRTPALLREASQCAGVPPQRG